MKQKAAAPEKSGAKELNPWPSYIQVKKIILCIYYLYG